MYTKEQRREIYIKAATLLFKKRILLNGCCWAIMQSTCSYAVFDRIQEFPEFALFKPRHLRASEYWFNGENQNDKRINALLLCAEMCND